MNWKTCLFVFYVFARSDVTSRQVIEVARRTHSFMDDGKFPYIETAVPWRKFYCRFESVILKEIKEKLNLIFANEREVLQNFDGMLQT